MRQIFGTCTGYMNGIYFQEGLLEIPTTKSIRMNSIHIKKKSNRSFRRRKVFGNEKEFDLEELDDNDIRLRQALEATKRRKIRNSIIGINAEKLLNQETKKEKQLNTANEPHEANDQTSAQSSKLIEAQLPTVEDRFAKQTNEVDINTHLLNFVEKKLKQERLAQNYSENGETNALNTKNESTVQNIKNSLHPNEHSFIRDAAALGAIREVDLGIISTDVDNLKNGRKRQKKRARMKEKLDSKALRTSEDAARDEFIEKMLKPISQDEESKGIYRRFRVYKDGTQD